MRTRDARDRAEDALVRFAILAGEHATDFVVIGGLNPDFLAPNAPQPHLGTTDVDLLFELGMIYDRDELDFGWLDRALSFAGFEAVASEAGWQWKGVLGDALVRLDLLCDVYDNSGQTVNLPGAVEASAQNLRGPAAALHNPVLREIAVSAAVKSETNNAPERVTLKFASLGGYIGAKAAALVGRNKPKDAYDLAFVIMYAPGGPRAAAAAVSSTKVAPYLQPVTPVVKEAVKRLVDQESMWVRAATDQLRAAGDDSAEDQLRADVAISARQFLAELSGTQDET